MQAGCNPAGCLLQLLLQQTELLLIDLLHLRILQ